MVPAPVYCPNCTHKLTLRQLAGRERPFCENCGYIHYLNPVPTVGVVIEMDGGIVLIQRGHAPHKGRWAFPSGYVEADERLEEAAVREAKEETGLDVEIIELADVNSYPEGPPSSGIMVFYRARPVGGQLIGGDDALDARVYLPDDVPVLPFRTHREMLSRWLLQRAGEGQSGETTDSLPFSVRLATPGDAQDVLDLVQMTPANFELDADAWSAAMLRLREMPSIQVHIAELNVAPRMVIGCVVVSVVNTLTGGHGFINDMGVLPAYRRQGVGAALVRAAVRHAQDMGLQSVIVNAQRATDRSRGFYAALGFADVPLMQLKLR
jgi:ADP-ribose pyrophosphatase YjhB (NUDIX family)/ribosomal protein S18 acetylase RimI-like enzyme